MAGEEAGRIAAIDKRGIAQRLVNSRTRLLKKYPFFGTLLMRLQFGVSSCGTAYTDSRHIVVDPEFVGRLSDKELDFILMHELLHCVLKHCTRGKDKISYIYNIACDIVVNSNILECMRLDDFKVDGEYAMHLTPSGAEGRKYTADEVYYELIKNPRIKVKDPDSGDKDVVIDIGELGPLDNHDEWSEICPTDGNEDMWDKLVEDYLDAQSGKDEGKNGSAKGCSIFGIPQAVREIYDDILTERSIRWKDVLRDFIENTMETTDYSFAPPDRRFNESEYMLPGDNPFMMEELSNIWFCIDTSGSVNPEELTRLYNEVKAVIEECHGAKGRISFFDTAVTDPVDFAREEDFAGIRPVGGGGTDFSAIFKYLQEEMGDNLPKAIVILTDGYATDVEEEEALGVPVVWVLINNDEDKPWGENIHININ